MPRMTSDTNEEGSEEFFNSICHWDEDYTSNSTTGDKQENKGKGKDSPTDVAGASGELSPVSQASSQGTIKSCSRSSSGKNVEQPKWEDVKQPHVYNDPFMGVHSDQMGSDPEFLEFQKLAKKINDKERQVDALKRGVPNARKRKASNSANIDGPESSNYVVYGVQDRMFVSTEE